MHLVLFLTRGKSLQSWDQAGILDREVAIYQRLCAQGVRVSFVTYGPPRDLAYVDRLSGIDVVCNRRRLPLVLYEALLPFLHGSLLRQCDVIKTNQARGSLTALYAARVWHRPLVVRFGYSWSENTARRLGDRALRTRLIRRVEGLVLRRADRIFVTTGAMRQDVALRFPDLVNRVSIVPNYVDTDRFCPQGRQQGKGLIYVGRLSPEKNLVALLQAVQALDVTLTLVGDGVLRSELQSRFGTLGQRLRMLGIVTQTEIPNLLNQSRIFVLPSLYEGQPKALIEAMACGLAVIGTDVPGTRDLIQHGHTGWLCQPDVDGLREAIRYLLAQPDLCARLGQQAREFAVERFSLERVAGMELRLLQRVVERKQHGLDEK